LKELWPPFSSKPMKDGKEIHSALFGLF